MCQTTFFLEKKLIRYMSAKSATRLWYKWIWAWQQIQPILWKNCWYLRQDIPTLAPMENESWMYAVTIEVSILDAMWFAIFEATKFYFFNIWSSPLIYSIGSNLNFSWRPPWQLGAKFAYFSIDFFSPLLFWSHNSTLYFLSLSSTMSRHTHKQ
jgi:hypothetical protein